MKKKIDYTDFTRDMKVHPDTGDLVLLVDEQSVKNRLKNIILTAPYERYKNPQFGVGLERYLFENVSQDTATLLEEVIRYNIETNEPYVVLESVNVYPDIDRNEYRIEVVFSLKTNPNPITLTHIIKRYR